MLVSTAADHHQKIICSRNNTNRQVHHGVDCAVAIENKAVLDDAKLNAVDSSGSLTKPRIPAELLYVPFRHFLNEVQTGDPLMSCDDPRWDLPRNSPGDKLQFLRDVLNFIEITARRHTMEEDLSADLNTVFSALLGVSVKRTLTPRARGDREGNADGAYEATGFGRGIFVLIRKDKLGAGCGGGDSLVELLGHYSNLLNFSPGRTAPAPMALVEVLGPRLVLSLAACDDLSRPSISAAVVSHSLLIQANPTVQISLLAATFLGLRRLITTITLQKDNMPPPILQEGDRYGMNLVFRTSNTDGFHKFLRSQAPYGLDAHSSCALAGDAPTFTIVQVCRGWRRIDMLNPTGYEWSSARSIQNQAEKDQCLSLVRQIVTRMHANGFVHGDLRAANALYGKAHNNGTKVILIDFDSSGVEGVARYPFLPFSIQYSPGAVPGCLVSRSHDLWRLETTDRFFP